MPSTSKASTEPTSDRDDRIVDPSFLEKHRNKKDLVRRLRTLIEVLREDEDAEAEEWPGLAATAAVLQSKQYLEHKDKQVRLLSLHASLEILAIYAPQVPWEDPQILQLFQHIVTQLGNLAHTTDESQPHFETYMHVLRLLAEVKIGAVLTELVLQDQHDDNNDNAPLDVLVDFIHTLLHSVRREHPAQVLQLVCESVVVCLDEYLQTETTIPIPVAILDELLLAIGQGPTVTVTKLQANQMPKAVPEPNPTYRAAASVIRSQINRLASPLAHLINGLLNADALVMEQSSILLTDAATGSSSEAGTTDVHAIILELPRVAPAILTTVMGTLAAHLSSAALHQRQASVDTLGRLFQAHTALSQTYAPCFRDWLARHVDVEARIRRLVIQYAVPDDESAAQVLQSVMAHDPSLPVRLQAIHHVCDWAYNNNKNNTADPTTTTTTTSSTTTTTRRLLLRAVGRRVRSKDPVERKDALTGLAQIYWKWQAQPVLQDVSDQTEVGDILRVLHQYLPTSEEEEDDFDDNNAYAWIPSCLWESVSVPDPDLRSRTLQLLDDVLLGSDSKNKKKHLSSTARAIGLVWILHKHYNPLLWRQRAALQQTVSQYVDARAHIRELPAGESILCIAESVVSTCHFVLV